MGSACVNHFSCQKVAKTVKMSQKKIKFKSTRPNVASEASNVYSTPPPGANIKVSNLNFPPGEGANLNFPSG